MIAQFCSCNEQPCLATILYFKTFLYQEYQFTNMLLSNKNLNIQGDWPGKFAQSFLSQKYYSCIVNYFETISFNMPEQIQTIVWVFGLCQLLSVLMMVKMPLQDYCHNCGQWWEVKSRNFLLINFIIISIRDILCNYQKGHALRKCHHFQFLLLLLWL